MVVGGLLAVGLAVEIVDVDAIMFEGETGLALVIVGVFGCMCVEVINALRDIMGVDVLVWLGVSVILCVFLDVILPDCVVK